MHRSTRTRRVLAASACGVLGATLAWLPAGPASASVDAQFSVSANADTNATCVLSSGDDSPTSTTATLSSGTAKRSVNLDATFTSTGNSSDVVQMSGHYTSAVTVTKKGANLAKAQMTGAGSVAVSADLGSSTACEPKAVIDGFGQMQFTEAQKGWLYAERTTVNRQGVTELEVLNNTTDQGVVVDFFQGRGSHAVSRGFVQPGTYIAVMAVGLTAGAEPPILKSPQRTSLNLVFHQAGSALAGAKGAGKRYVEFPGAVSCSKHQASLRWTSRAGHVLDGAFLVNGKRQAFDSTPRGGEKIGLKHLKSTADLTITAKLRLKGGGSATATRTYVPCKG
jgi:hypothetical protein